MLDPGTPTKPTGPPVHQKITWMMFELDLAPQLAKENTVYLTEILCFAVLYCMATGQLGQLVYSMY